MACGRGAGTAPGAAGPTEAEAATLKRADAADGASDRVVSKCAVCGLAMDGTAEHASSFAGYDLHFCSSECKDAFDHDPRAVLRRLSVPAR
jgi:YHS domain-containing protein